MYKTLEDGFLSLSIVDVLFSEVAVEERERERERENEREVELCCISFLFSLLLVIISFCLLALPLSLLLLLPFPPSTPATLSLLGATRLVDGGWQKAVHWLLVLFEWAESPWSGGGEKEERRRRERCLVVLLSSSLCVECMAEGRRESLP